jgi:transaldolase / glucose-6-phosphate isomerase
MRMNVIEGFADLGQSIWFDNISRGMINSGELASMVTQGLRGVTSNPTIFDKAISGSTDYDKQLKSLLERSPDMDVGEIIETLMVKDIQDGADILLPVYDRTKGEDGYISIEVSPGKARDTEATIEEVRKLARLVGRRNLMVKIPATKEGLPAIEQMLYEGININVTLIFSGERYRDVANAYLAALEKRLAEGKPIDHIASVASVFVSRIDTLVDEQLQKKIDTGEGEAGHLAGLAGKAAVANTKIIYQIFKELFESPRMGALNARGGRVQRPLWGSTGTKNPAYSDLLYVENLIGPHTVNTVPPKTWAAILDHAHPRPTIETNLDDARRTLDELRKAGIDMAWIMHKLEEDGVASFMKSYDDLSRNLQEKKADLVSNMAQGR